MKFVWLALLVSVAIGQNAWAQTRKSPAQTKKSAPRKLARAEIMAIQECLEMIRGCQLRDGAIIQVNEGNGAVWIPPYFASYAALALLAGHEREDVSRVRGLLEWCATHQEKEGYWCDYEGTAENYASNGKVDAWDSSAAMFLLVAGRYQQTGGKPSRSVINAAKNSLGCIQTVTDKDGLSWAKPDYKVKYLMDNVEVYAGLRAGAAFFTAVGSAKEAAEATAQAVLIAKKLPLYWQPAEKHFAYALHPNGVFEGGMTKAYPHGQAQLFGVAFIAPKVEAFAAAEQFPVERDRLAAMGVERWLVAASRLGIEAEWRKRVVREIATFGETKAYVFRPAIAALGLLEGADWMPSLAGTK